MQKSFTQLFWTYQNFFSTQTSELHSLNIVFDSSKWFEELISKYEETLPEIDMRLIERILKKVQ